jgi:hypothetical protein
MNAITATVQADFTPGSQERWMLDNPGASGNGSVFVWLALMLAFAIIAGRKYKGK